MNEEQQITKTDKSRRWIRIAGSVLTGGLFLWLLWQQDWQAVGSALIQLPVWVWLLVFLIHVLHAILNTLRWYLLIRAQSISMTFKEANRLAFAGLFASNFLPTAIGGDLLRIAGIRKHNPDLSVGLASIIVDRFINIVGSLFYLPFTVAVFLPAIQRGELTVSTSAFFTTFFKPIKRWLAKFLTALTYWAKQPTVVLYAFLVSITADLILIFSHWMLARGFGIEASFIEVLAIRTFSYFVMMLPISINGYGLREIGITTLYIAIGADPTQAVAFALITRLFLILRTLPGGLWVSNAMAATKAES